MLLCIPHTRTCLTWKWIDRYKYSTWSIVLILVQTNYVKDCQHSVWHNSYIATTFEGKRGSRDGLICLLLIGHSKLNSVLTPPWALESLSWKMLFLKALMQCFRATLWVLHQELALLCAAPWGSAMARLGDACSIHQRGHFLMYSEGIRNLETSWFCFYFNNSKSLTISYI